MTTAMTVLANGDVIVGSAPSTDGTTKTAGAGCLVVLSPEGTAVGHDRLGPTSTGRGT